MRRRSAQVGALVLGLLRTLAAALDSYDDGEDQEDVLAATSELVSTFVELHVPRISQRPDFPVRGAARNMDLNLPGSRRRRRRDAVDAAVGESTRLVVAAMASSRDRAAATPSPRRRTHMFPRTGRRPRPLLRLDTRRSS